MQSWNNIPITYIMQVVFISDSHNAIKYRLNCKLFMLNHEFQISLKTPMAMHKL